MSSWQPVTQDKIPESAREGVRSLFLCPDLQSDNPLLPLDLFRRSESVRSSSLRGRGRRRGGIAESPVVDTCREQGQQQALLVKKWHYKTVIIVYVQLSTTIRKVLETKGCLPPQLPPVTSGRVHPSGGCERTGRK